MAQFDVFIDFHLSKDIQGNALYTIVAVIGFVQNSGREFTTDHTIADNTVRTGNIVPMVIHRAGYLTRNIIIKTCQERSCQLSMSMS